VEKTAPVFNRKGYDGTSLADLTGVTGLTKGALYGNFIDKDEIAAEAFKYSMHKVKELVRQHLSASLTNKERLSALLDFYAKFVFRPPIAGGCPLLNTCVEADDHRTSMRRVVVAELTDIISFICDLIESGIKAKEFRPEVESREIAYTIFCAIEGALIFSRVEKSRQPMDLIIRHCNKILDNIST
jgi:AcrR family transcriptional regulator